ncbi:MAG: hypothetical protein MHM6MM_005189 [Cercozoa sp. M6MM]
MKLLLLQSLVAMLSFGAFVSATSARSESSASESRADSLNFELLRQYPPCARVSCSPFALDGTLDYFFAVVFRSCFPGSQDPCQSKIRKAEEWKPGKINRQRGQPTPYDLRQKLKEAVTPADTEASKAPLPPPFGMTAPQMTTVTEETPNRTGIGSDRDARVLDNWSIAVEAEEREEDNLEEEELEEESKEWVAQTHSAPVPMPLAASAIAPLGSVNSELEPNSESECTTGVPVTWYALARQQYGEVSNEALLSSLGENKDTPRSGASGIDVPSELDSS